MPTFAFPNDGALAERLGTGLQNLLQRFDSARHLRKPLSAMLRGVLLFCIAMKSKAISAFFMNNSG